MKAKTTSTVLDNFKLGYEELPPKGKRSLRGNTIKHLTKPNKGSILKGVKLKRKDNKMASNKTKTSKTDVIKSIAWLVEASFRAFVGWVLLNNFDHFVTTAVAFYAIGTAGIIVVTHFVRAHN